MSDAKVFIHPRGLGSLMSSLVSNLEKKREFFVLPEFEKSEFTEEAQMFFTRNNMEEREMYDVVDKFDESPDKLTPNEKELRKKYLTIVLKYIDIYRDEIKLRLKKGLINPSMIYSRILGDPQGPPQGGPQAQSTQDDISKYVIGNVDPTFNTIKRIITLLIMEIEGPCIKTPCIKTPCNKNPYIVGIIFLGIFSLFFVILSIILYRQNSK
jgi:hypothetical protein